MYTRVCFSYLMARLILAFSSNTCQELYLDSASPNTPALRTQEWVLHSAVSLLLPVCVNYPAHTCTTNWSPQALPTPIPRTEFLSGCQGYQCFKSHELKLLLKTRQIFPQSLLLLFSCSVALCLPVSWLFVPCHAMPDPDPCNKEPAPDRNCLNLKRGCV